MAGLGAKQTKTALASAQADLLARQLVQARADVVQAQAGLLQVRAGLEATGFWKSMPFVGVHVRAFEDAERVGTTVTDSILALLDAAASVEDALASVGIGATLDPSVAPTRSFSDLTREEKRTILARIHDVLPEVRIAREKATIALEAWDRIPQNELIAPVQRAFEPATRQLRQLQRGLDEAVSLADVMLPIMGYPTEKNYLVLLQNADELRPTGGFIGTVGTIKIDAAEVKETKFEDVYSVDGPVAALWKDAPPDPLKKQLGVNAWFLRDSNWSPDFPQTAQRVLDVYAREKALAGISIGPLSGVIALQPDFFRDLLRLTGPISVDGKSFDADHFFDELQYDVEIGFLKEGIPVPQRKEIVAKIGDVLIKTLMSQPASRWPALLDLATTSLSRKDILIYDRDPVFLALLDARNWSGRTRGTAHDYLWVVDANLAALKTDGVMEKTIRYSVDATDAQGPVATVTLSYKNANRIIDWRHTRYRDYVRVYVPEGSELISTSGAMLADRNQTGGRVVPGTVEVYKDLGKTVFAAFWSIEPGETRELRFTYRLPASVVANVSEGMYQLLVQKQPGSNTRLTLDHKFGKNVMSATPSEDPKEFGDAEYRLTVPFDRDQLIEVKLQP